MVTPAGTETDCTRPSRRTGSDRTDPSPVRSSALHPSPYATLRTRRAASPVRTRSVSSSWRPTPTDRTPSRSPAPPADEDAGRSHARPRTRVFVKARRKCPGSCPSDATADRQERLRAPDLPAGPTSFRASAIRRRTRGTSNTLRSRSSAPPPDSTLGFTTRIACVPVSTHRSRPPPSRTPARRAARAARAGRGGAPEPARRRSR